MNLRAWWLTLALCLTTMSCHRSAASERVEDARPVGNDPQVDRPVEVFSWWKRSGDGASISGLFAEHRRHHPNDIVIHASSDFSGPARTNLRSRMQAGDPPEIFQANAGTDLLQWAKPNGVDARESRLQALDALPHVAEMRRALPAMLLAAITWDGTLYGIPSNIHRLNSLFYNKKIFEKHGLAEPKTINDLFRIGEQLRGTGIVPISLGCREPWTASLLVFESLLVAREGISFYRDYFTGKISSHDPRMVATLRQTLEMLPLFNKNYAEISWDQALEMTISGRAAMTVMGDWTRLAYAERHLKAGVDYEEVPFPGSESSLVFTSDAFAIPRSARNRAGAERLLSTMSTAAGQASIHGGKNTLPARTDVVLDTDDPVILAKVEVLRSGNIGLALSGLVPPQFHNDVSIALLDMLAERDVEPVLQTLNSRHMLLKR